MSEILLPPLLPPIRIPINRLFVWVWVLMYIVQSNFVLNYTYSHSLTLSFALIFSSAQKRNISESFCATYWLLCATHTHTHTQPENGVNILVNHKRWNQINEAIVQVHIVILSVSLSSQPHHSTVFGFSTSSSTYD